MKVPDAVVEATGTAAGFLRATLRVTSNPTVLTAGYKHNVIPDRAEALVDLRPFAGQEDEVLARIRELVGPDVEIEVMHHDIGLELPFEGPLVEKMIAALDKHDPGAPVLPYLMSGGTDNKALAKLGIAGYGFAPLQLTGDLNFPAMFHGIDERVPLSASLKALWGADVLLRAVTAGDDYQIGFTAPPGLSGPFTQIGRVEAGQGVVLALNGKEIAVPNPGYKHF